MPSLDLQKVKLDEGILAELVRENDRVVLWRPEGEDREYQYWERIGTMPRAQVQMDQGLCTVTASLVRARQRKSSGFLGKLARKLTGGEESWMLPNGQPAEKCGERRANLLLAWPEDEMLLLDEAAARTRWPAMTRFERLGERLYLIDGAVGSAAPPPPTPEGVAGVNGAGEMGSPITHAEQVLEAARQRGDRRGELAAMIDLGILVQNENQLQRSVELLETAIGLARELGNTSREVDALHNLAYGWLAMGQPDPARQAFEIALRISREIGDPYAEKLIVERLGIAYATLRNPERALELADQALAMTRKLGDRQQEARVLWNQAIALADMNRREEAIARAEESLELLRKLNKPEASWYGAQLQRYRMDMSALTVAAPGVTTGSTAPAGADPNAGPGLLRMAVSATRAMMQFIGSGLQTSPAPIQQQRFATCEACEHHTGQRCRVCGCFTQLKTRMAYEQCPIGKWPA
ncbi:MAG: tetratricopeptide repeat protein [Isosphaeraceae bacterium]